MSKNRIRRIAPALGLAITMSASPVLASSHREAPLIAQDPTADSTDVYAFLSLDGPAPGAGAKVTLIANYIPFQEPSGGPNYFNFSDSVLYEIKVDNTGDAVEDIVFQFRFETTVKNGGTFLYNTGSLDGPDAAGRNVVQTYTLTRVDIAADGTRTKSTLGTGLKTAPAFIGPRSNTSKVAYEATAAALTYTLGSGASAVKAFAGPRDEGFFLDINAIFDLLNISRVAGLGTDTAVDGTAGFNVSTLALEVPVAMLTRTGAEPPAFSNDMGGPDAMLGVWTSASRRKHNVLRKGDDPRDFGPWVQVSRLAIPLVNEVVVPLGFKDQYNRTEPKDDLTNIAGYVVDPELSRLLRDVHGLSVPPTPRVDLVQVISGLPGALTSRTDLQPADILRLNVSIPQTASGAANNLGVIAGDVGGFPNGRRVGDDVVDILERVVGGGILAAGDPPGAATTWAGQFPNNALNDGVTANDVAYLGTFPYLATPHSGFDHKHLDHTNP